MWRGALQVPQGILYVKVLEAKHLPWLDWLTLPDAYVKLFVRGRRKRRTAVCKHTFHPKYPLFPLHCCARECGRCLPSCCAHAGEGLLCICTSLNAPPLTDHPRFAYLCRRHT